MATFILVHGTFAKEAEWPLMRQKLTEAAKASGEEAMFDDVKWSGRNTAKARSLAAESISKKVENLKSKSPNEKIFLIGHSHGGSAIAYYLKADNPRCTPVEGIAGCAFLSTPFVAMRHREMPTKISHTIIIMLAFLYVMSFPFVLSTFSWLKQKLIPGVEIPGLLLAYISLAPLILFIITYDIIPRSFSSQHLAALRMKAQETAKIPRGNNIFLRFSGDEAAAVLSTVQFISWINIKVGTVVDKFTRPLHLLFDLMDEGPYGWISGFFPILLFFFAAVSNWVLFDNAGSRAWTSDWFTFLSISFVYLMSVLVVAALWVFLAHSLMLYFFGWGNLLTGFLVEIAVEPIPYGNHELVHIEWPDGDEMPINDMTHSATHSNPYAVDYIKKWVVTTLKTKAR